MRDDDGAERNTGASALWLPAQQTAGPAAGPAPGLRTMRPESTGVPAASKAIDWNWQQQDAPLPAALPLPVAAAQRASTPRSNVAAALLTEPLRAPVYHQPRPIAAAAGHTVAPVRQLNRAMQRPPARGRGWRLPRISLLRLVWWELALVLVVLAVGRAWPIAATLSAAAAVILVCTATRLRGNWLSVLLGRRIRLALREGDGDLPQSEDAPAVLLRLLAPAAAFATVDIGGEAEVVNRPEEQVMVLRPDDPDSTGFARAALSADLLPERDPATQPELRLQLILHRGPHAGNFGEQTGAARTWLAVRAIREADFAEDEELRIALRNAVRRISRRLRRDGIGFSALAGNELRGCVSALAHTGQGRSMIRERARYWNAGPIVQVCLRVSGMDSRSGPDRIPVLTRLLSATPAVACTIGVAPADPETGAVLRIASTTAHAADAAAEHLARVGPLRGAHLERLDGLHASGVAASLPIGGNQP